MNTRQAIFLIVATAAFAAIPLFVSSPFAITVLTTIFLWTYLSSSWNLLGGMTGLLSFGHAVFLGVGAYCSAFFFIKFGWHPLIGGAIGVAASCVLGYAIAYVSARYNLVHLHFALVTTAIGQIAVFTAMGIEIIGGPSGISLPIRATPAQLFFRNPAVYYWIFLLMSAGVIALTMIIRHRRMGLYFLCVRESEPAALGAGIDVVHQKLLATVISAALTAAGGVIYAQFLRFLDPDSIFSWLVSLQMVIPAMLGGSYAILGPAVGSAIFVSLQELTRTVVSFAGAPLVIVGLVLIPVVRFMPKGLVPSVGAVLRRRRAKPQRLGAASAAVGSLTKLPKVSHQDAEVILRVEGLRKRFGGVQAIDDVTLHCREGERLAIIGPNGAGKSTLFALLGGFIKPDSGSIWFAGDRIDGLGANQVCRRGLARTFQTAQPFKELSVLDNILASTFLRAPTHRDAVRAAHEILELFELNNFAPEKALDLNIIDQKRLELARAYATQPRLILLDEVGAGLTGPELKQLITVLASLNASHGTTIIFIEHIMSMVRELAERVIVLHHGEILAGGSLDEISSDPTVIRAYLGESTLAA
jgi:branched-chain amino acid transport system permease protein